MISKTTKYALKALIYLARAYGMGPVLISDISHEEGIPKKFLEQILLTLKNNSILHSRIGKGGGYYLGKAPREISVGAVIRIIEGPLAPVPCVSETAYVKCNECLDGRTCGIRLVMKDVMDALTNILDKTSLAEMLEREESAMKKTMGIPDYYI